MCTFLKFVLITKIIFKYLSKVHYIYFIAYKNLPFSIYSQKEWTSMARSAYLRTILKPDIVAIEEKTSRKILIRNFGQILVKELLTILTSRRKSIYSEYRDIVSKSELNFRNEISLEHFIL